MVKNNKAIITILIFILTILLLLTGCSSKQTPEDTKEKVIQELDYLDGKIISILNKLNNISLQNYEVTSKEITMGKEESGRK